MTGLAAGWGSEAWVLEARDRPGGICSSYYVRPGSGERLGSAPSDGDAYRFEIGGGHWIFGVDDEVGRLLGSLVTLRRYERRSGVFFPEQELIVPYPIQYNLRYLGRELATEILHELAGGLGGEGATMAEWLESVFGPTLTRIFFGPFHERYTAGLWRTIAPQDGYKTPVSLDLAVKGAHESTAAVGYNVSFVYPEEGLGVLADRLAGACRVRYQKEAVAVDVERKEVYFSDGTCERFRRLISTVPLNKMVELCGINLEGVPDPYTSVLVLNVGAYRGPRCPSEHWLYVVDSRAGFHRVGFYSNVDRRFLPGAHSSHVERVALYVERSYEGGKKPEEHEVESYSRDVVKELQAWEWIGEVEAMDATWIDVAYTWRWPGSDWRERALRALEERGVLQAGRYGRWVFQGIAESIREGLRVAEKLGTRTKT